MSWDMFRCRVASSPRCDFLASVPHAGGDGGMRGIEIWPRTFHGYIDAVECLDANLTCVA